MNSQKKEVILFQVKEKFGTIVNQSNTYLNVRLFIAQNFPVNESEATECAEAYCQFLQEKKAHYKDINRVFMTVSHDIQRATGYDLIDNFCHAFKGLTYSIPS